MGTEFQKLKELSEMFIQPKYDLEEFQSRLETVMFPDEIEGMKHEILNELEEIRFTKLKSNHYRYGVKVAKKILNAITV